MNVFWRPEPLNEHEHKLLTLCLDAHAQSALRQNVSSVVFTQAAFGSGDYTKAVSAALMTLGGVHAPLMETWDFLEMGRSVQGFIDANLKIPGWGNSFEKDHHDTVWIPFRDYLREHFKIVASNIDRVTTMLHGLGKHIFPNPSAFTAATGIALRMPPEILPWLFLNGRLNTWTAMFCNTLKQSQNGGIPSEL